MTVLSVKHGWTGSGRVEICWRRQAIAGTIPLVYVVFFAQSILEYQGLGSGADLKDTWRTAATALMDGLKDIDPRTWMMIGGALVVLMFLTRHSRQH